MSDFTKLHRLERVAALNDASTKARSIWSLIHHAIDRRGHMTLGGAEFRSVLVRRLGVDTSERQWFYAGLRELQERGLIEIRGDVFILHGHAGGGVIEGQKKATSSRPVTDLPGTSDGPPADLQPTSDGPLTDLSGTSGQPPTDLLPGSSGNHSDPSPRARDQNREEENREEEIRTDPEGASGLAKKMLDAYGRESMARRTLFVTVTPELWKLAERHAPGLDATARASGTTFDALLGLAMDRWFGVRGKSEPDAFAMRIGFKFAQFAPNAASLAVADPSAPKARASPRRGMTPIATHEDHARAVQAAGGTDGIADGQI